MQLKIPVTTINRKFVEWKENINKLPNRVITERSFIGMLLDQLLTDEATYQSSKLISGLDEYTDFLTIEISTSSISQGRFFIPDHSIIYFNLMIHRFMHEVLLDRILDRDSLGINQMETIYDFIEDYGLEALIDKLPERLRKGQYRLREEKQIGSLRSPLKKIRYKKKLRKRIVNTV